MGRIFAVEHVTLDGVMQAPGQADTRGGFAHGGWAHRFGDEVQARVMSEHMAAHEGALLLGRRTYDEFYGYWPKQVGNPITEKFAKTEKFVASRTLTEPLPWQNSTLLSGDAVGTIAELRRERDLCVLGSGELLRDLMRHDLVDEFLLQIHPLVLGSGQRLFDRAELGELQLTDTVQTTTGVLIATYQRGAAA